MSIDNTPLARKLCAAYVSHSMRIRMDYAIQKYVPDTPGRFWLQLADVVSVAMLEAQSQLLQPATGALISEEIRCPDCSQGPMLPPLDGKRVCATCGYEMQVKSQ